MATLKRWNTSPPGGWQYYQKETAFTIKAENGHQLVQLVVDHRKYKNLEPQDPLAVRLEIERQLCVRLGYGECKAEGPDDKWVARDGKQRIATMSAVLAFSKTALSFFKSGMELAPMEEVQRRAANCRSCPLNQPMTGCSCNLFYKIIALTVPRERKLDGLYVCRACDCSLEAKVNLTPEQIVASNKGRNITWPEQECFQKSIMAAANLPSA